MTAAEMQSHIDELAARHNVEICKIQDHSDRAHAHPDTRSICGMAVKNERDYAILLHEMGHIVMPGASAKLPKVVVWGYALMEGDISKQDELILAENLAWDWARSHARQWTPMMEETKNWGLGTYYKKREDLVRSMNLPDAPILRDVMRPVWLKIKSQWEKLEMAA